MRGKGTKRFAKIVFGTLVIAAAIKARESTAARRFATDATTRGRTWSNRQLNRALQAPVVKSQGERWRAMRSPD